MCSGVERAPGSTRTLLTPTVTLPAARPRSVQVERKAPSSLRSLSTSFQWTMCSDMYRLSTRPTALLIVGDAAAIEGFGREARLAFAQQPQLALSKQLANLGEKLLGTRTLPLEGLDALEPPHHCACLLHPAKVAAENARNCANRATKALRSGRGSRLREQSCRRARGLPAQRSARRAEEARPGPLGGREGQERGGAAPRARLRRRRHRPRRA